jgi:Ca2+-binding EF-hand superfamily protein
VRERFRHADTDRSGALNPVEFSKCMESLELGLTRSQVHALMRDADADGNGEIDIDEFIQLFYDRILFLEREKKIKELQKAVFEETSNLLADGRSKSTSRRGRLGSSDPKDSEEDKLDDAAVLAMEEMLINLFTKADFGCSGYLTATEFRSILDSLDLGVTSFQQTILMAEADVNEDGKIQYGEFVPVCAELLQAFKAKAAAERGTIEAEKDIEDKVKIYISNNKNLLKAKITSVQINLSEADKERTGKMSRKDVTQLLRGNQTLEKSEVNMILHSLPVDDNGIVEYNGIDRIMEEVFEANVRRKYQDELPHSSLESHLVQLLEDEERRLRKEEETALAEANGGGRSPSSMQEEKLKKMRGAKNGLVNLDFDDEMEDGTIGSVLSVTAGFLPASSIYDALKHAKHLRLSRVQLLAVMSLAHVDEGSMEEIPYKTFAGTAAEMITKFYDPREIKRRALLERRTDMNPLNLLNGVSREDMKSRLMDNLVRIDQKKRGNVSEEMFRQTCNKCLEQCELTSSDISALVASAPRNSAGRIVWKNYIEQVYDIVLNMKRERVLQGSDIEVEEALEEDLLIVPPSKKVIASLTRALYEQVSLESRRGDITIHFSESQSAAISGDEAGGMAHKSRERHSMMLMAGTSGHKEKRSSSLEVLSATKEDMFEEVELFAEQKILYVVDDQGRPLNTQGGVYYSGVKGAVMDTMELWVTVRTLNSQDEEFQRIQIEGCKRKGGACVLEKIFKMPCLAVADNEAAEDFAKNLTAGLKILQSEDGGRSFKF